MAGSPSRGVVYIAYGAAAMSECQQSIATLRRTQNSLLPINVIAEGDPPFPSPYTIQRTVLPDDRADPGARRIKTRLASLSPYPITLYLDADTRVNGSLAPLFAILDHWPLVLTYSVRQGEDVLGNCGNVDRSVTFEEVGTPDVLGLQCGVIGFRRDDPRVRRLFAAWAEEWERYRDRDQAAFIRALHREPCPVWLVSRDWNGGSIVEHHYGAAARPRSAV